MRHTHRELRQRVEEFLEPYRDLVSWKWDKKEHHPFLMLEAGEMRGKCTYAETPSDFRWIENMLSDVRHKLRVMGVIDEADFAKVASGSRKTVMHAKLAEALNAHREKAREKKAARAKAEEATDKPVEAKTKPKAPAPAPKPEPAPEPIPAPAMVKPVGGPVALDIVARIIQETVEDAVRRHIGAVDRRLERLERLLSELEEAVTRPQPYENGETVSA